MSKTCNFLGLRSNSLPPLFSSTGNSHFLRPSSALILPKAASRPFDRWIRSSSRRRLVLGGFVGVSLWMNNNMSGNFGGKSFIASARQTNPSPVEQVFFSLFFQLGFRISRAHCCFKVRSFRHLGLSVKTKCRLNNEAYTCLSRMFVEISEIELSLFEFRRWITLIGPRLSHSKKKISSDLTSKIKSQAFGYSLTLFCSLC